MRLLNKSTFSLVCIIFLLAFVSLPAMAANVKATWADGTWTIDFDGLKAADEVTVHAVDPTEDVALTVPDRTATPANFANVAAGKTATKGTIDAALGKVIAVGLSVTRGTDTIYYQRVTFPVAGLDAEVEETDLVLVPKLKKLTVSNYFVSNAHRTETITFEFLRAQSGSHGAASANLHVSDVFDPTDAFDAADWTLVGVSGNNKVTVRFDGATAPLVVGLAGTYALAADPQADGQATVNIDNDAPVVGITGIVRRTTESSGRADPDATGPDSDALIEGDFTIIFTISDTPAVAGSIDFDSLAYDASLTKADGSKEDAAALKLTFEDFGVATEADKQRAMDQGLTIDEDGADNTVGTPDDIIYYAVTVKQGSGNIAAKEDVDISITVSDKAENDSTPATTMVDLAERTVDPDDDAVFESAAPGTGGSLTPGSMITVTFDKDPGDVTASVGTVSGKDKTRTITIPATQAAGSIMLNLTWGAKGKKALLYTVVIDTTTAVSGKITVPANSIVVVVRDETSTHAIALRAHFPNITLVPWAGMPDLQAFFDTNALTGGGALIVKQHGDSTADDYIARDPGTVGISEVMWAIDESKFGNAMEQRANQWIELHNLNTNKKLADAESKDDGSVDVMLVAKRGANAIATDANINGNLAAPYLDVVTNAFNNRPGAAVWNLPGQNGNPSSNKVFISMARILPEDHKPDDPKPFDVARQKDGQYIGRYTNTDGATKSRDGRASGSWTASTTPYARYGTPIRIGDVVIGQVLSEFHGTPGRVNTFSPQRPDVKDARTDVPASPLIINEVANRNNENNQYEWIELKNVSDADVNVNNYQISILTAVDSDKPFIYLPNRNINIPPGGVLLLVDSDPAGPNQENHPLAIGWNVVKDAELQVPGLGNLGISDTSKHGRYVVVKFGEDSAYSSGLPDTDEFILVLRKPDSTNHEHGKGDKGRAELGTADLDKIVDIAGYVGGDKLKKTGYTNSVSETKLWPLKQQGAPESDRNKLVAGIVHHRQNNGRNGLAGASTVHNDKKEGQVSYGHAGYTGIGYKRQAANSAMHGGTPGYDNGAQKGRVSDLAMDKLIISEIMLSQGEEGARTTLPQWIEIYNPSPHPVSLGGWRLIIENPRDLIRTINLGGGSVKTILSEQTILVVSGTARDIGSDTLPSSTVFPPTRVYNVYQHQRNEFDMTSRFDPILDQEAFHITLIDGAALDLSKDDQKAIADDPTKSLRVSGKYYTISDVVGNLDGNPRTNDTPEDNGKMAFPMGMTEDGDRTSLIRIFEDGVARDGTGMVKPLGGGDADVARMKGIDSKYSWVHAVDTKQRFVRHTWYGDESDWGTPADRGGQILPVELSSFRPTLLDGKVTIRWTTESELDNAGFNIYRSETRDGEYKQVNTELIQGAGTTGERNAYKWVDATAKPGVVYYYQIEDVSFAGEHQTLAITKLKGLISAKNKLTTTWSELKQASQ